MSSQVGELAALGTALSWTISSLAFTAAGKRIGSLNVNFIRLAQTLLLLAVFGWLARGLPWPTDAAGPVWGWLLLSGLIGYFLGDLCLFEAYLVIGTRLTTLAMALTPPLTALIGWAMLGEQLSGRDWLGMAVTLTGMALVVAEKRGESKGAQHARNLRWGLLLGFGAALGQAVGLVLSKQGMNGYDAFAANQIRVVAGLAGFAVLLTVRRGWRTLAGTLRQRAAMGFTTAGAFFGPFLGVGLALFAVQNVATGIVATITALVPVFVIPPTLWWHGERLGWRAVTGALIAVAGVALISL